jgi:hypothetical protein
VEDVRAALWRTPRWSKPEWEDADAQEVAALAGHLLRGDTYEEYLRPGWTPGQLLNERLKSEQARAVAADARASAMAAEAIDLRSRFNLERERAEAAEKMLAQAAAEALDRLSELGAMRERAAAAQEKLAAAEYRAMAAQLRADAIEQSTTWRATAPLRRAVGALPWLRGILRRGVARIKNFRRL